MQMTQTEHSIDVQVSPANGRTEAEGSEEKSDARMHRVGLVRRQQGISLRTAARHMGEHASRLRDQEEESTDLTLSQLYAWQQVLDVPVSDLLVESDGPLSRPVMQRAQMVRLMKTAASILESADNPAVRCMAENLINQLIETMPELREISAWHSIGQRRSQEEMGVAYERRLADDMVGGSQLD